MLLKIENHTFVEEQTMEDLRHKYFVYIDDCYIRRDALAKLAFLKMQNLHPLCIDMKSAFKGIGFAQHQMPNAIIIHCLENRDWNEQEKILIRIFTDWKIPIFFVYGAHEKKGNIQEAEIEGVNYLPYTCLRSMLMKIQKSINCTVKV